MVAGTRQRWLSDVERESLQSNAARERSAAARFDALYPASRRMALVREVVATRSRELTLAYRNVVMVTEGYKSRTGAAGVEELHVEPCVIFVVKRKWPAGTAGPAGQHLPARLLAYGGGDAQRELYAVPTDVQPADAYIGAVARSASCVRLGDAHPPFRLPGALTCGVRVLGSGGESGLALSAMHVLSPVPAQAQPAAGAGFSAIGDGPALRGRSAPWGGHIDAIGGTGFDVQLAEITDRAWFNQSAFSGLQLAVVRPHVATHEAFDDLAASMRFQILAPANHPAHVGAEREPMLAQFTGMVHDEFPISYQVRASGTLQTVPIRHHELIRVRVLDDCPAPESGDSGSAVVTWWPDGSMVLVGMFMASDDRPGRQRICYVQPAWQLFETDNWSALPAGTAALVATFALP